ncbi:LuxR C-terminal-related transcriptional regulator [Umezawaea sp. Da 62-37]|uniref:LuxR C-terminal-related transcriptional regulator n=1 Tax=Umezawaea sp. Da 62-37 TaxID=3075927 RepID=UPI0028F6C1A4|nr:LuxR C-terminal-related transcriptional regulator [Umezawaea sp. Da 62-37]WNV84103.1 LuxR C-terminal-related transcriptional regulator [Umezawaea sp. Da 62-37]
MFEHLGVTPEQSRVYGVLIRVGTCTVDEIATELPDLAAGPVVESLAALGLVQRRSGDPAVWQAVAPDLAVEMLIAAREDGHRRARAEALPLVELYLRGRDEQHQDDSAMVEVVTGAGAVRDLWVTLLAGARTEVCVLDQPPYISPPEDHVALEVGTRARQVQWRVIYDRSGVELPGRLAEIVHLVAAGERARVTPALPFKLGLVDARVAVLPIASNGVVDKVLLIRPSALLDVLISTFDLYWDRGIPFTPRSVSAGAADEVADPQLLALLAAGLTDESIARQLGLAPRTVQRRVRQLMDRSGAQTRFQAGVQAMRRGWL